jgi:hypothetical protein
MNYIFCHLGSLPPHLFDSIQSIRNTEEDVNIVLVTDNDANIDGVKILKVTDIWSDQTRSAMNTPLFSTENDPLWRTSIFRIFLVRDALKNLGLDSCYHFDSDVLLFQPSNIFSHLIEDFDGMYITPCNSDEVVFGFSRIGGLEKQDQLCDILHELLFDEIKRQKYFVSMPNEMQLLSGISKERPDLIKLLQTLPNESGIIFDPSSYGQYFGGTNQGHGPGWYGTHHDIGLEIHKGTIKPVMIDKKPFVLYNDEYYPIVNLHIHSKNTSVFL